MVRTEASTRLWDGLWTAAHLAETTRDSRAAMFSEHATADGKPTGRGYAWTISGSPDSIVARLAGSVWIGSSAVLFLPSDHFAAVVSTNLGFQQPSALLDSLAMAWRHHPLPTP